MILKLHHEYYSGNYKVINNNITNVIFMKNADTELNNCNNQIF